MPLPLIATDLPKEQERQHRTIIAATVNELAKVYPSEGTWTPTVGGSVADGTHTYSLQLGTYLKIGRRVFADFAITLTAKDAALSGSVFIKGLPFTSKNNAASLAGVAIGFYSNIDLSAGKSQLTAITVFNSTNCALIECGDNVAAANILAAAIGNTSEIRGTACYDADA